MSTRLNAVIAGIAEVADQEIRKDFRADCCIAATRTVLRVLDHFGFKGSALPVKCFLYNPNYTAAIKRHDNPPTHDQRLLKQWFTKNKAWSVGIGVPAGPSVGRFPGHLVATVQNNLIDASIKQAERPEHKLLVPPVLVTPYKDFPIYLESSEGCVMEYREDKINNDYLRSPDWLEPSRTKRATKKIIAYVERYLVRSN